MTATKTRPVRFADVRPGMRFVKQIINQNDPRFGESVILDVVEVRREGGDLYSVIGETNETDFLGNPYNGGPGGRADGTLEVVTFDVGDLAVYLFAYRDRDGEHLLTRMCRVMELVNESGMVRVEHTDGSADRFGRLGWVGESDLQWTSAVRSV